MAVCSDSRVFVVLMICLVSSLCLLWYFHFRDSDLARIEKLFSRSPEPEKVEKWRLQEGEFVCCGVRILVLVHCCFIPSGIGVEEQLVSNSSTPLSKAEGFIAEGVDWAGEFVWGFQVRV